MLRGRQCVQKHYSIFMPWQQKTDSILLILSHFSHKNHLKHCGAESMYCCSARTDIDDGCAWDHSNSFLQGLNMCVEVTSSPKFKVPFNPR